VRFLLLALMLLVCSVRAAAAGPLRIAIECEDSGRTKACPAFLLGFVEHDKLFLPSPRSDAQVILYFTATGVANVDKAHLRFVGTVAGAPPVVEVDVELDTRADDDTQVAQLQPAFARGAVLYVAAMHPEAVLITMAAPADEVIVAPHTRPWGFAASVSGFGSWTENYRSANVYGSVGVSRIEKESRLGFDLSGSYGLSDQPPLEVDGMNIDLDTDQYSLGAGMSGAKLLDAHWSVGGDAQVWHEDPEGRFELGSSVEGGIEWDHYAADDPRGNRLAVAYMVGWEVDKYNAPNVIKQRFTQFAFHQLAASATVRKDKIGYGLSLSLWSEMIHPMIRSTLSASPFIELQVGPHVDVNLSLSVTGRALPETIVDPTNYEQVIRASYAEPLSAFGSFGLTFHWDRTNGARNDRFGG
jgi:hypothetical protein